MFTPIDIQQKKFKGALGYKKKDVDAFMADLLDSYEYLYKENLDLNEKIKNLTQTINQYKSIEKSLQKALILAQSAAEDVRDTANNSAKLIESEARSKAKQIVLDARKEYEEIYNKTVAMARQLEVYKTQCKQAAMAQVEILNGDMYAIDFEELERTFKIETEDETLGFIEEKQEEVRIDKNSEKLNDSTEKILDAVNKASSDLDDAAENVSEEAAATRENEELTPEELQINDEFYTLVAEVMEDEGEENYNEENYNDENNVEA
ncbi:MAG: DivIVA domain-containing protein [Lachnospiraceae bacterium]|nr:DivIVA domain-containing protein [Lachnospiraceae bacterium]